MPKYSKQFKLDVKRAINDGLAVNTIVKQFGVPASTVRLWAKEVASENSRRTHSIPLQTIAKPTSTIVSRSLSKLEHSFVSKLLETYKPVVCLAPNLDVSSCTAQPASTNHYIIKDYNVFYNRDEDNLSLALNRSAKKVFAVLSSKPDTDVHLHFVGDHFNTGSLYLKRIDEPEQYKVFMAVLNSLRNLIVRLKEVMRYKNVTFTIEGADFRGSLLDSFLKQTFSLPYHKPEDCMLFLSGLSSKCKEDEHIIKSFNQSKSEIVRKVYTDLKDLKLGPNEFSFGDLNLEKGIASIRTIKGSRLCTVNIIHW